MKANFLFICFYNKGRTPKSQGQNFKKFLSFGNKPPKPSDVILKQLAFVI